MDDQLLYLSGLSEQILRLYKTAEEKRGIMDGQPRVGALWREHYSDTIETVDEVTCVEVMFEDLARLDEVPKSLQRLKKKGVEFVVHGATLSLGSSGPPDRRRLADMARVADLLDASVVSEHVAFRRVGELDSWHVLPVQRTTDMLEAFIENLAEVKAVIDRPFAVENVAHLFAWPDNEIGYAQFLREVVELGDALLLLDLENLRIDSVNMRIDCIQVIDALPLDRLAYVHMAGGDELDGFLYDSHSKSIPAETYQLLEELARRTPVSRVTIERDVNAPSTSELRMEIINILQAVKRGRLRGTERSDA
jgi:uncharacterized protein (UPF0276 family)